MELKRGDIVLAAGRGDYGKVRPAVIVQSDNLIAGHPSIVLCPMTSDLQGHDVRVRVEPDRANGLHQTSEIMVDKITAVPVQQVRPPIGVLAGADLAAVDRALTLLLGLGER